MIVLPWVFLLISGSLTCVAHIYSANIYYCVDPRLLLLLLSDFCGQHSISLHGLQVYRYYVSPSLHGCHHNNTSTICHIYLPLTLSEDPDSVKKLTRAKLSGLLGQTWTGQIPVASWFFHLGKFREFLRNDWFLINSPYTLTCKE